MPTTWRDKFPWSTAVAAVVQRDVRIAYRRRRETLHPLMFFIMVAVLTALATGADPQLLQKMAPAVIWVAALLAVLLGLDGLFGADYRDGALAQMLLSPHPPTLLALAKVLAHWLVCCAPMIAAAPLLAEMLNFPRAAWPALLLGLALGSAAMCLLGAIGAALTLAARGGGALLGLLILPLYIPILIFGASAAQTAALGMHPSGQLLWLAAILLLLLALAPLAIVAALRISVH